MTKNIVAPKHKKRPHRAAGNVVESLTALCSAAWLVAVTVDQFAATSINIFTVIRSGTVL
jgi:hypothetical protein